MGLQSVSTKHELSCVVNSSQGLEAGEYLKLKNTFVFEGGGPTSFVHFSLFVTGLQVNCLFLKRDSI